MQPTGVCEGTLLSIEDPRRFTSFTTDENGHASVVLQVPEAHCGHAIQLIDLTTCDTSGPQPFGP